VPHLPGLHLLLTEPAAGQRRRRTRRGIDVRCQATAEAAGARQFCAIRSYLSTAAKHGLNFFDALVMLAEGEPWMPTAT